MSVNPPKPILPETQSPMAVAQDLMDQKTTLEKINDAVNSRRIYVAYQPIVDSRDFRKVFSFEVLVRITDEAGRIIPTSEYIHEIEDHELGRIVDTEVLQICIRYMSQNPKISLSLNVSARSIGHPPWRTILQDSVLRTPSIAKRMILEFREESVHRVPEHVTTFMRENSATGMTFALDNFGAGSTTFHTFRRFMFDLVKFDSSITRPAIDDIDGEALLTALIAFSYQLSMQVIVDKVESQRMAEFFLKLNVNYLQGNFFGKPRIQYK